MKFPRAIDLLKEEIIFASEKIRDIKSNPSGYENATQSLESWQKSIVDLNEELKLLELDRP